MADYRAAARRIGRKYFGDDADIFVRQIGAESGFNPNARSPAGALGIAQIMPDTARGWGVDPMDPEAALEAAARNMKRYVQQFGGWEGALRAYNAGPGAVQKSKGYAETNNYVKKILQGQGGGSVPTTSSPSTGGPSPLAPTTGGDSGVAKFLAVLAMMPNYQAKNPALMNVLNMANRTSPVSAPTSPGGGVTPRGPGGPVTPSPVDKGAPKVSELFWDPAGGWDEGKSIGAIGGHQHVHVAGRSKGLTRALLRRAQKMGLTVREHPDYDKVDPVHTGGSHHYSGRAGDLSGSEAQKRQFVDWVRRRYGLK